MMKAAVEHLVHCCHGDDRPECPILENLADQNLRSSTGVHVTGKTKHGFARARNPIGLD